MLGNNKKEVILNVVLIGLIITIPLPSLSGFSSDRTATGDMMASEASQTARMM